MAFKTAVTATSRRAYHSEDRSTILHSIARYILSQKQHKKSTSIGAISRALNMDKSSVSDRLNDLKKMKSIILDAKEYILVSTGVERDPVTKKTVEMWTLERVDIQEYTLSCPVSGIQMGLPI